jgi:aminopeptidase N
MQMHPIFLLAVTTLVACQKTTPIAMETYAQDPHSFAQPNTTVVTHLNLNLSVDFDKHTLGGTARWTLKQPHGDTVIFDTHQLAVSQVWVDGQAVSPTWGVPDPILGTALRIPLDPNAKEVTIAYTTHPEAKALQWFEPSQTLGGTHPFLFSQSQAILARSWVPCQDGPGIRFTYEAQVKVPNGLLALMSATNPTQASGDGQYSFVMEQPVPSYLLAIAAGKLAYQSTGPRTGVYAEPGLIDTAAWEFADVEAMMTAAENLYGPYAWGRYDLLVLPPSFPFGGMENPRLTFATPTILAGDRSLVSLVAHELAHSWSGNLVTNATWNDFWLNEGFTVYFEMRIMEAVYGREYSEMLAQLSYDGLVAEVADFMQHGQSADTRLKLSLNNRNPDDGMTTIAYDKGYLLLRTLEQQVGREDWDAFLKDYFTRNAFQVMNTEQFLALLQEALPQTDTAMLNRWIYGEGIPEGADIPVSTRFKAVEDAARAFMSNSTLPDGAQWSTHEWLHFINQLNQPNRAQLQALDAAFGFSSTQNAEIFAAWLQPTLRLAGGYQTGTSVDFQQHVEAFLIRVGRRKFLTPTYRALVETNQVEWARSIYAKARPGYHAVARETMDALLQVNPSGV